jgi:hypothetical protein
VAAGAGRGLHAAVVGAVEVLADLIAGGVACVRGVDEADPRAHEQRLHGGHGDVERGRQVGVGEPVELAHEQRRALLLGQAADVLDQPGEVLAPLGLLDRVVERLARDVEHLGGRRDRAAQVVDAAVVGDAVEPRAHVHLAVVGAQGAERADEHVLHDVLGVLPCAGREHLAHVGEQPLAVAVVQHVERVVVARAELDQQLVVRTQTQQGGRDRQMTEPCWVMDG